MTVNLTTLDAHEQPNPELKGTWKTYSRTEHADFVNHPDIDDLSIPEKAAEFQLAGSIPTETLLTAFRSLEGNDWQPSSDITNAPIYFHPLLPDSDVRFKPKDPDVHKPLSIKQVLDRRLSWVTLGGQYDWTNRVYPGQKPPEFPPDISGLLQTLFPETLAQAAIVNFYTPGDTMMMHRDVSEETDKGLVSLSIGCDALFMIAPNDYNARSSELEKEFGRNPYLLLRLRSGDAIYMTRDSRFAWHGVPKVLKGTCPDFLADWPAEEGKYEEWKGWMKNKRINLNVRQMRD
ncbi:Alkylated DNA repair protein AlkB [Apiospora kogelbergensis]|uniref:mRNA N(6)-methyladenine demethylase n=1 Tax=Apiospora kogelbergensis TaxID=1337665 RepID=A0AAW0R064_9PEZI